MVEQAPVALVLVGGANNRFSPLEHKSFLRFGGVTLLERLLHGLAAAGVQDAVVIGNAANRELSSGAVSRVPELQTTFVEQPEAKGMGDALLCARGALASLGERAFYVVQPSDIVAEDLNRRVLAAWV